MHIVNEVTEQRQVNAHEQRGFQTVDQGRLEPNNPAGPGDRSRDETEQPVHGADQEGGRDGCQANLDQQGQTQRQLSTRRKYEEDRQQGDQPERLVAVREMDAVEAGEAPGGEGQGGLEIIKGVVGDEAVEQER